MYFIKIDTNNYFQKSYQFILGQFFEFYPIQPLVEHLFKSSKAYFRKNRKLEINRCLLTFNNNSMTIYCNVCLAFSSEPNLFTQGL